MMLDIGILLMGAIFPLNLYPELSMNMHQVKVECGKWQCSGKMLCLITSGGGERWKVS